MHRLTVATRKNQSESSRSGNRGVDVSVNPRDIADQHAAILDGYAAMQEALSGTLDVETLENIEYAVSAIDDVRQPKQRTGREPAQQGFDTRVAAIMAFAAEVARRRGHIADAEIERIRVSGFTDAQIVAIIAAISVNVMTNAFGKLLPAESHCSTERGEESP